jgi:hypothetical protein
MKLCAKVVTTRQQLVIMQASTPTAGMRWGVMMFKFAMNEDCQAALQGHKGLARTKLGLDKDLTPTQQVHKSELRLLFKAASKCSF